MKSVQLFETLLLAAVITFLITQIGLNRNQSLKFEDSGEAFTKEREKRELIELRDPKTGKIPRNITKRSLAFAKTLPGSYSTLINKGISTQNAQIDWRGPFYWGGRTRALGIDVRDKNVMIAGGVTGGMWRSNDAGMTWTLTTPPDELHSISCLVQDTRPGKEDIWYYGTGEYRSSIGLRGNGVFKSIDNGRSWTVLGATSNENHSIFDQPYDFVWDIVIDPSAPQDKDVVLISTAIGGIYRSVDGGENWENVLGGFGNRFSLYTSLDVTSKGVFYASLSSSSADRNGSVTKGIYRSIDGNYWTEITPSNWPANYNRIEIGIAPSDENQVYFVGETPEAGKWTTNSRGMDLWHSLWKYTYINGDGSGDGGVWEDRSQSIPRPEIVRQHMNSQASYNLLIKVKPDDPDFVILGATNLYRSINGFADTTTTVLIGGTCPDESCDYFYRYPNHHSDQHAVFFHPSSSDIMYTGSDGGVHKTLDVSAERVEWISLNSGYITTQFFTCAIDHGDNLSDKVLGGLQDNGTLFHNKNQILTPWHDVLRADGFFCQIPDNSDGTMYISQNSSSQPMIKIWKIKVDENGEKIAERRIDPIGGEDFIWNTPFILDPNDNNIMFVAGGKIIWRNNDLSAIDLNGEKDSISTNWDSLGVTRVTGSTAFYPEEITALGMSKFPSDILYYGTSYGNIFKVINAGSVNPEVVDVTGNNFPGSEPNVSCIDVNSKDADHVIISFSNYGVESIYETRDGGESWTPISGNLEENKGGAGNGPSIQWIESVHLFNKLLVFAGTSTGLYMTSYLDGGATVWEQYSSDLVGNVWVDMVDIREQDAFIAVATHGTGMFTGKISGLTPLPTEITLLSPSDKATEIGKTHEFTWIENPTAVRYQLELSLDSEFNQIYRIEKGIKENKIRLTGIEIGNIEYFWRVAAVNSSGLGEYSDVWSFKTEIAPPVLLFPENKAEDIIKEVTLYWESASGAEAYHLLISKNVLFTNIVIDTIGIVNDSYEFKGLESETKYYWKVSTISETGETGFSSHFYFKTGKFVSVEYSHAFSLSLKQNFPNPVFDNTVFVVISPIEVNSEFIISDMNGIIVNSRSQILNVGENRITLNLRHFPQGTYFAVLKSHGKTLTRSFKVIR